MTTRSPQMKSQRASVATRSLVGDTLNRGSVCRGRSESDLNRSRKVQPHPFAIVRGALIAIALETGIDRWHSSATDAQMHTNAAFAAQFDLWHSPTLLAQSRKNADLATTRRTTSTWVSIASHYMCGKVLANVFCH